MKTILFFDQNLNERGTSIATYDYAHFNEEILGNKSIIATFADRGNGEHSSYNKFKNRFGKIYEVEVNFKELEKIPCDYVYNLKYGYNDGNLVNHVKNLVHVVFPSYEPHGDVYAYVSKWLAKTHGNNSPFVPHMINLPKTPLNYKSFLDIKHETLVVGWMGGNNFELEFAQKVVERVAKERGKDIVFLFMNQDAFCHLDNVKFLRGTTDQNEKVGFINTCDVMLHARERGETFGLAIAEFSSMNKPIITYSKSPERNHIEILGDTGIYYHDYQSLYDILSNLQTNFCRGGSWNCYQDYTPEKVMEQFNKTFLQ